MYTYIIIDDERLIRLGLISKVKEINTEEFQCIGEASNGLEGLQLISEAEPDIVITDMKMAKMDGVEFLQRLHEAHPGIPVIVLSGYKAFDYMNQAIEHGVVGYVLKPFSSEELEKQLLKAVARLEQQKNILKMQERMVSLEKRTEGMEFLKLIIEPWNIENEENGQYAMDHWHILISFYSNIPDSIQFLREGIMRCYGKEGYVLLGNPGINGQYFLLFDAEKETEIILKSLTFCNAFSFRLLFTNACNTIYVVICAENQRTDQVPYVLIVFIDSCSNPQYLAGTGCFDLTVVKFPVVLRNIKKQK